MRNKSEQTRPITISVVAPGRPLTKEEADKVTKAAAAIYPSDRLSLQFHPQCFLQDGHFAGDDKTRTNAFVEAANDPTTHAVWFARGGYGACRLYDAAYAQLDDHARSKRYLGYSDMGFILARLYALGFKTLAHGPMPIDATRAGGDGALKRALNYLVEGYAAPDALPKGKKLAAFNLTVLSNILGAGWRPDFTDHILMVEDIAEYHYRIDRAFFTLAANDSTRRAAGLMLGRFSNIPQNDVSFGKDVEEIAREWCKRADIAFLGSADIGHDAENRIIPFGMNQ